MRTCGAKAAERDAQDERMPSHLFNSYPRINQLIGKLRRLRLAFACCESAGHKKGSLGEEWRDISITYC